MAVLLWDVSGALQFLSFPGSAFLVSAISWISVSALLDASFSRLSLLTSMHSWPLACFLLFLLSLPSFSIFSYGSGERLPKPQMDGPPPQPARQQQLSQHQRSRQQQQSVPNMAISERDDDK